MQQKEINVQLFSHTDPVRMRPPFSFVPLKLAIPLDSSVTIGRKQADISFRSKVVSRTHAEFHVNALGQLFLKDTGSSSGTFVNRSRLSATTAQSSLHPIKSGDIIQLGVDYQGRTEEIFRAVVFRVFITLTSQKPKHDKQLMKAALGNLMLATRGLPPGKGECESNECCICITTIQPMQALFISGCSHCFHYKCMLDGIFWCPMCRGVSNLEEAVDEDSESVTSERVRSMSEGRYEHYDDPMELIEVVEEREVIEISSDEGQSPIDTHHASHSDRPVGGFPFTFQTPVNIPGPPRYMDLPGSFPGAVSPLSPFVFGSAAVFDGTNARSSLTIQPSMSMHSNLVTPLQLAGRVEKVDTSESNDEDAGNQSRDDGEAGDLEAVIAAMRAKARTGDTRFMRQIKAMLE